MRPEGRFPALLLASALGMATIGACADGSGDSAQPSTDTSPAESAGPADPVGVIAIGHSGMTGFVSDPARPTWNVVENSWATGTSPDVNSIYLRLVEAVPDTEGHVANAAINGARASQLAAQADAALRRVPNPQLALIQTIDNDVRCDGTDSERVPEFGAAVASALERIAEASPETAILLVSTTGRPATYVAAVQDEPAAVSRWERDTSMCALFAPTGTVSEAGVAALTTILEAYEAEQMRVCAAVAQCVIGGAFATHTYTLDDLGSDYLHLSVIGHTRVAAMIWPTVAEMLALPE